MENVPLKLFFLKFSWAQPSFVRACKNHKIPTTLNFHVLFTRKINRSLGHKQISMPFIRRWDIAYRNWGKSAKLHGASFCLVGARLLKLKLEFYSPVVLLAFRAWNVYWKPSKSLLHHKTSSRWDVSIEAPPVDGLANFSWRSFNFWYLNNRTIEKFLTAKLLDVLIYPVKPCQQIIVLLSPNTAPNAGLLLNSFHRLRKR